MKKIYEQGVIQQTSGGSKYKGPVKKQGSVVSSTQQPAAVSPTKVKPTNVVKQGGDIPLSSDLMNKTVNFYRDNANKSFRFQARITGISKDKMGNVIIKNSISPNEGFRFNCETGVFYAGTDEVYNTVLSIKLDKMYCAKSSGGARVPKADFASNAQPSQGQTMAEGKRIRRITESDMIRLVDMVLNEQNGKLKKEDVVACSKIGVKTMGYCDKKTKKPIGKLPCSFIGVKSVGMCDGRTGKPTK